MVQQDAEVDMIPLMDRLPLNSYLFDYFSRFNSTMNHREERLGAALTLLQK